jgi:hypothetical protein
MEANPSDYALLGQQFLRTAWLFQGVCSFPTLLVLGSSVFNQLFYPYLSYYRFMFVLFLQSPPLTLLVASKKAISLADSGTTVPT